MHEMSIAIPLVHQLQQLAAEHGAERVETLTVTAGAMRHIVPELLVDAFASVAEGTCAEGALLEVIIEPVVARCRGCDTRYDATIDSYECPKCNQADVEIVEGNTIILKSVTLEGADG